MDSARLRPNESTDAGLVVCQSEEFGLCVRAVGPFSKGDVLDRFTGVISADVTQHSLQVGPGQHISGTCFVGYLSHGCDPNCRLDMANFELIALRDIAPGALLTIDYAETEDVLHTQFQCNCGASACRGWITGKNDKASGPAAAGGGSRAAPE